MEQIKFLTGSGYFFKDYKKYQNIHHDLDWIIIDDKQKEIFKRNHINNECLFFYRKIINKLELLKYIKYLKKCCIYALTIPEFNQQYNITIEDLKQFSDFFQNIIGKHSYYKIIYNAYIENNDFILTQEQRDKAFEEYKNYKNKIKLIKQEKRNKLQS